MEFMTMSYLGEEVAEELIDVLFGEGLPLVHEHSIHILNEGTAVAQDVNAGLVHTLRLVDLVPEFSKIGTVKRDSLISYHGT